MNQPANHAVEDTEIDFGALAARAIEHRWLISIAIIFITAAVSLYAFLARPVYRVTAVLMPANHGHAISLGGEAGGALGLLASGLGVGGSRNSELEEAIAIMRSRAFTEEFISSEGLLPKLFPRKWNAITHRWRVPRSRQPTFAEAYKYFNKKIRTITLNARTGLIKVQIEWFDPVDAANWAEHLVGSLNAEMRQRAIHHANASLEFLRTQIKKTSNLEMRAAIGDLMKMELKKRMVAQVTPDYALQIVAAPVGTDGVKPVWPKKMLLIAFGPIIGFIIGFFLSYLPYFDKSSDK